MRPRSFPHASAAAFASRGAPPRRSSLISANPGSRVSGRQSCSRATDFVITDATCAGRTVRSRPSRPYPSRKNAKPKSGMPTLITTAAWPGAIIPIASCVKRCARFRKKRFRWIQVNSRSRMAAWLRSYFRSLIVKPVSAAAIVKTNALSREMPPSGCIPFRL